VNFSDIQGLFQDLHALLV